MTSPNMDASEGVAAQPRAPRACYTVEDFEFLAFLGQGSFSTVHHVRLKRDGSEYALKIMDKRHLLRERKQKYARNERVILDKAEHPGVVRLHFTFQDDLSLYMGLDLCPGADLFAQVKASGNFTVPIAQFYTAQVVQVLEYLNSIGVAHRDIKPENMLLTREGHLKVCDFGSASILPDGPMASLAMPKQDDERTNSFVGTADYVSPEVIDSQPITWRCDLWSLGCCLYQFMVGKPPFRAGSEYLTFQNILSRTFQMPDTVPAVVADLINRLLVLEPEKRIGGGERGLAELKEHEFLEGVNWDTLFTQQPPFKPLVVLRGPSANRDEEAWEVRKPEEEAKSQ